VTPFVFFLLPVGLADLVFDAPLRRISSSVNRENTRFDQKFAKRFQTKNAAPEGAASLTGRKSVRPSVFLVLHRTLMNLSDNG
jgi:hypothetical protein